MFDMTKLCADDEIYVCQACGKTSRTRGGFDENDNFVADRGWDVSCTLYAVKISKAHYEQLKRKKEAAR